VLDSTTSAVPPNHPARVAEEDAPGQHMKLQNPTVAKNPTVVLSQLAPTKRRLKTKILAD